MKLFSWSVMSLFVLVCVVLAVDSATVDTVIKNIKNVTDAAQGFRLNEVGMVVLLSAIIKLIISLMKFKPVAVYLDTEKVKVIKPYIAVVLGILGGIVSNLTIGYEIKTAIVFGMIAGFGSIGIHESVKSLQGKNK